MAEIAIQDTNFSFTAPANDTDAEITIKRSRFIGSVRRVMTASDAASLVKEFPVLYPKANHYCFAYRVGVGVPLEHASDAGEPAGTAGRPILGVIKRRMLTNTLIVVTRYFGGIKLGVRGLIDAYTEAAQAAAESAGVSVFELCNTVFLSCGYDYSKTLISALRKQGFGEECMTINYDSCVSLKMEVPCSKRHVLTPVLEEMHARNFITHLDWDEAVEARAIIS